MTVAVFAVVAIGISSGCRWPANDTDGWVGGPVTPSPVVVTVSEPGLRPFGQPVATGIVVADHEMVLVFTNEYGHLIVLWRNVSSGIFEAELLPGLSDRLAATAPPFRNLRQIATPRGQLIEFGDIRATDVERISIEDSGKTYDAKFTRWSHDPSFVLFWVLRSGSPIPQSSPIGPGESDPLAPELYPLVSAYQGGEVLATARIRPPAGRQK